MSDAVSWVDGCGCGCGPCCHHRVTHQASYAPLGESWKCAMSQYLYPFIEQHVKSGHA